MDVRMPVMNGYEATEAIRSLERPDAQTIPIMVVFATMMYARSRMKGENIIDSIRQSYPQSLEPQTPSSAAALPWKWY